MPKESGMTRSPMEGVLDDQLKDLRKLPPEQRTPVTDTLSTLAVVVLEHEQRALRYRRDMRSQMGHLETNQEEALNHLRRLTNGNPGNGKHSVNSSKSFMSKAWDNWPWILFGAITSGGTMGGLMDFFGVF